MFLHLFNAMFYFMSVVDMDMTEMRIIAFLPLIGLDNFMKEFFYTFSIMKRSRYHWDTEETSYFVTVNIVASLIDLIKHIKGTYHANVHIDKLGGEV